jgi:hypothetical protein
MAPPPALVATRPPVQAELPSAADLKDKSERENPLRKIALYASLGFIFLRVSVLSELLLYVTHVNFYLLYLFGPPAIFGVLVTGGLGRTLRGNAAKYWMAFFLWLILSTPFSSWKGGSTGMALNYARFNFPMLFILAGLAMTWKEVRLIFYTFAIGAMASLGTTRLFGKMDDEGRMRLDSSGNIGNSNDLGAHLLLVLPFLIYVMLDRKRSSFLRMAMIPPIAYGVWIVLGTASRGCLLALTIMFLFSLLRANAGQRVAALVVGVVMAVTIPFLLPSNVRGRLSTLFSEQNQDPLLAQEARESREAREYLFKQSVRYTVEHPLFGVGLGQFTNYEGNEQVSEGRHGAWSVTHNFMTQISSECGVPALIFALLGIGSAMLMVGRTYREARKKGFRDIANACFCYHLAMVGYLASIVFLAQAYHYYIPAMIGLAVVMCTIATRYMSAQETMPVAAVR